MACSGGGRCQSNCYKEEEEAEPEVKKEEKRPQKGKRLTTQIDSTLANLVLDDGVLCSKCKEEKSAFSAQSNNPSSEGGGLCLSCFRSSLFSKFKLAVTSHSMISPTDKVLVAFSGGPASRFSSLSLGVYFFFCFYSLSWFFFFCCYFPSGFHFCCVLSIMVKILSFFLGYFPSGFGFCCVYWSVMEKDE